MSVTVICPLMTAFFLYVMDLGLLGTWLAIVLDQCIRAGCASLLLYRMKPHIGMQMKKLCEE